MKPKLTFFLLLSLFYSKALHAEVMDKMLSEKHILLGGIALGIIGFFLCRIRSWLGIPTLSFVLLGAISFQIDLVNDSFFREAILRESGYRYFIVNYISAFIALFGHILGIWLKRKKTKVKEIIHS